eukprot:UN32391
MIKKRKSIFKTSICDKILNLLTDKCKIPKTDDLNEEFFGTERVGTPEHMIDENGLRSTSCNSYLHGRTFERKRNLKLICNAQVTNIEVEYDYKSGMPYVTGVSYVSGSQKYRVTARKEVIICCGSIGTPHFVAIVGNRRSGRF